MNRSPAHKQPVGIVAIGVVVLGLLTGCSTPGGGTMDAETARDQLVTVMNDTADRLGIEGWEPVGGVPSASSCGENGAEFAYAIGVEPRQEHLADAKTVQEYWTSLGMDVRLVEDPVPAVFATGGPVTGLSFQTAPGLYGILGTSLCGEGDPRELNGAGSDKR